MINIINRKMDIPFEYRNIGFEGDNKVNSITFIVSDLALSGFDFKLDIRTGNEIGIIDLIKTVEADKIILTWEILQEHTANNGVLHAQLRAFSNNNEVWHSDTGYFNIGESINATDYFPPILPSEFEQMEARVTQAKNETLSAKDIVVTKANEVATNTQTVTENTTIVVQKADEVAGNTTEVAENTEIAETSANTATQALSDLLAMLGTDIATLTGGKLTPSQIPAIAIVDTFVATNETEMLTLTAETGDVCIRTDESKTYILQGTNPALLTDWQHLKTPTNYADTAGHALTADNTENADKINGHRVVAMTQAQYDIAVTEPDTVYLVG